MPILTLIFAVIFFSRCTDDKSSSGETDDQSASAFDLNEARGIIQEKTKRFTEAHILKDTAYLNNIVSNDARYFPPNSEIVVGKEAIALLNTEWVNYEIQEFTEETITFYGNEDYLIDEGTYFLRFGEDGVTDRGKYINIWTKVNGDWKICSNIWNTSLPLSMMDEEK